MTVTPRFGYALLEELSLNRPAIRMTDGSAMLPQASPDMSGLPVIRHTVSRDEYVPIALTPAPSGPELVLKRLQGGATAVHVGTDQQVSGFELANKIWFSPGLEPYRNALEQAIARFRAS